MQKKVSYAELVEFFYRTHDPTQVGGQGPDVGSQYRSALFPHTDEQTSIARKVTEEVQKKHFDPHGTRIVTEIQQVPASDLYVLQGRQESCTNAAASPPRTTTKST